MSRRGFTLVELLVVITIIGILAALLLGAVQRARVTAARARIQAEINGIDTTIKDFKNTSQSLPPNAQTDDGGVIVENTVLTDFKQFMSRAFPQHREPPQLIEALVGLSATAPGTAPGSVNANQATNLPGGMTAAESLVFWIGGFSEDPKYPISGPGGPSYQLKSGVADNEGDPITDRSWRLGINVQNLGPRGSDDYFPKDADYNRYVVYADPRDPSVKRRINFWVLRAPGSPTPYVYFDASRGAGVQASNDVPAATDLVTFGNAGELLEPLEQLRGVYAIKQASASAGSTFRYQFANKGAFQVMHSGFDREWLLIDPNSPTPLAMPHVDTTGAMIPTETLFPAGPWTGELADTQTNFTDGILEGAGQ